MGSGILIRKAIEKYGLDNFHKDILYEAATRQDIFEKEAELVTAIFIRRKDTYNLTEGGDIGSTLEAKRRGGQIAGQKAKEYKLGWFSAEGQLKKLEILREKKIGAAHDPQVRSEMSRRGNSPEAIAKKKSTYAKMKFHQGEDNPMSKRCWVHKTETAESLTILKEDLEKYLEQGYEKGRLSKRMRECPNCHKLFIAHSKDSTKVSCCSMKCRVEFAKKK